MRVRSRPAHRSWTIWARIRSTRLSWSWLLKKRSILKFQTKTPRRSAPSTTRWTTSVSTPRQASNLARRVVITGIGMICSLGNTTAEVWPALLAGKSGVDRITAFDASAYACQIAAEVRNFDPLNFIEKKEVKKMGRFIHFALAASDEALKMSQLNVTNENS